MHGPPGVWELFQPVSIRARPIGRAMLPGMGRGWRAQHVSIRARPIGRAMRTDHSGSSSYTRVSIRARPIGRAMPGRCGGRGRSGQVSIRARPIGRAMRRCGQAAASGVTFQSAPGRLAGRCDRPLARWSHLDGFNPRPADWPGDAAAEAEERQRQAVSIRARPIGRAMLPSGVGLLHTKSFQSAPGRLAGRCSARVTCGFRDEVERACAKRGPGASRDAGIGTTWFSEFLKIIGLDGARTCRVFHCCLGFARQTTSGPSKSTERKVPYCLTRSSCGPMRR